jgi:hypothetical protein
MVNISSTKGGAAEPPVGQFWAIANTIRSDRIANRDK